MDGVKTTQRQEKIGVLETVPVQNKFSEIFWIQTKDCYGFGQIDVRRRVSVLRQNENRYPVVEEFVLNSSKGE